MPVLVVGADTADGTAIIDALSDREGEVRAFVTDPDVGVRLKSQGVKVATGDVSDASHVGGAATSVFSAVLISQAASDERERAFADTPEAVVQAWAEGLADAGVRRIIWVGATQLAEAGGLTSISPEFAVVDEADATKAAHQVAELDERLTL